MNYVVAEPGDARTVTGLVRETISAVYPRYYPAEVVRFFLDHHRAERVEADIARGAVRLLVVGGEPVGTGTRAGNQISRVFVAPGRQGKGYGSFIMDRLEEEIARESDRAELDASLPAAALYERRGYAAKRHCRLPVDGGAVLAYEIMEKRLARPGDAFDGRSFVRDDYRVAFRQRGPALWAEFSSAEALSGHMVGAARADGCAEMLYHAVDARGRVAHGAYLARIASLPGGERELREQWLGENGATESTARGEAK